MGRKHPGKKIVVKSIQKNSSEKGAPGGKEIIIQRKLFMNPSKKGWKTRKKRVWG